jgi:hypothetical protein
MHVRTLVLATAFVFGLVAHSTTVDAGKVEKKFGGKILLSDKRFPSSAKSENAYISALNKQKKAKFWENKKEKEWKVYFAAFFKKPLRDLEYTIKLYDVSRGRQLVSSFEQYTDSSDQSSLLSYLILERKVFGVNKKLMMVIESQGRVVASAQFQILGEAERYTGKVDFSEDDTKGGD